MLSNRCYAIKYFITTLPTLGNLNRCSFNLIAISRCSSTPVERNERGADIQNDVRTPDDVRHVAGGMFKSDRVLGGQLGLPRDFELH